MISYMGWVNPSKEPKLTPKGKKCALEVCLDRLNKNHLGIVFGGLLPKSS